MKNEEQSDGKDIEITLWGGPPSHSEHLWFRHRDHGWARGGFKKTFLQPTNFFRPTLPIPFLGGTNWAFSEITQLSCDSPWTKSRFSNCLRQQEHALFDSLRTFPRPITKQSGQKGNDFKNWQPSFSTVQSLRFPCCGFSYRCVYSYDLFHAVRFVWWLEIKLTLFTWVCSIIRWVLSRSESTIFEKEQCKILAWTFWQFQPKNCNSGQQFFNTCKLFLDQQSSQWCTSRCGTSMKKTSLESQSIITACKWGFRACKNDEDGCLY